MSRLEKRISTYQAIKEESAGLGELTGAYIVLESITHSADFDVESWHLKRPILPCKKSYFQNSTASRLAQKPTLFRFGWLNPRMRTLRI